MIITLALGIGANAPLETVVSGGMVKVIWPGQEALGKCVRLMADTAPCRVVVGIAEDIAHNDLTSSARLHLYVPVDQWKYSARSLLVRLRGDAAAQSEVLRQAVQKVMPGRSHVVVRPMPKIVDQQQRSWRLGATMFVAFGFLALIVAAVGLYGVITYNVTQRMHELGVRVALGARPGDVVGLIAKQGAQLALLGVALGTILALTAAHWLQPLLFQQSAKDPFVYAAVGAVMLIVALAASTGPALRAAKADPSVARRSD